MNLYEYVVSNPVNFTDPSGKLLLADDILTLLLLAALAAAAANANQPIPKTCPLKPPKWDFFDFNWFIPWILQSTKDGDSKEEKDKDKDKKGDGKSEPKEEPRPDIKQPGTGRNPNGTPKNPIDQQEGLLGHRNNGGLVDSTGKTEQYFDNVLDDLTKWDIDDLIDLDW